MTEKITEALIVVVVGMGSVFSVLALLAGVLVVLSALGLKRTSSTVAEDDESRNIIEDEEGEIAAVISAALTAALGEMPVVKQVKLADEQDERSNWAAAGRQMVLGSHNLHKK